MSPKLKDSAYYSFHTYRNIPSLAAVVVSVRRFVGLRRFNGLSKPSQGNSNRQTEQDPAQPPEWWTTAVTWTPLRTLREECNRHSIPLIEQGSEELPPGTFYSKRVTLNPELRENVGSAPAVLGD